MLQGLPTRGEESAENGPRQGAEPAGGGAEGAAGGAASAGGGVAHASSVASLTAVKEMAEREAAAGKTAAQVQLPCKIHTSSPSAIVGR